MIDTLLQPIVARAEESPENLCLVFTHEDGSKEEIDTLQFHESMVQYAVNLNNLGLGSNELVILVLKHSLELLYAFWGAMYLGAIPSIFPYLTEKLDPELYMAQVRKLVAHSGARAVITYREFKPVLSELLAGTGCQVVDIEKANQEWDINTILRPEKTLTNNKIAFLQHSSGTTGLQKGVALSHQAVLNQLTAYSKALNLNGEDLIVSWLPLYHDMGLIAGFVLPIVMGIPLVLISPFHWVRDPKILLWAIHDYKGTLAWLPNFAYNHCVRGIRLRELEGLDLSSWRAAVNCSEPVRYDSHQLFLERFAPYGFQTSALATSYAMAENTFAVTQSVPGQTAHIDWVHRADLQEKGHARPVERTRSEATPMVSCGETIEGTEIFISDEKGQELPERLVGEVAIRGNSMFKEYFQRPEITAEAIKNGWYFTGDMGYLAEGQLYITGRKKDLIIVGGKNIYPQDIEAIANNVPGIHPGRAVSFGVPNVRLGTESIVLICELESKFDIEKLKAIELDIRSRIVSQTEVTLGEVRLVDEKWLIKTSSGKIARNANREKYFSESKKFKTQTKQVKNAFT